MGYCGGHDEETIQQNAFNLLYALDEVVTPMGYKESVTYKQIEDFVKMDSAEEKLSEIIEKSKLENAAEVMKKRAAEIDKKRADERKKLSSPSSFGYSGLDALGSSIKSKMGSNSNSADYNIRSLSSANYNYDDNAGNVRIESHGNSNKGKYGYNDSDSDDGGY